MSLSDDWFDALERDYESLIAEDDDGGGEVITIAPPSGQAPGPYPIDDVPEREPLDLVKRATSPRAPAQIVEPTADNPFALYTWQRAALDAWRTNGHRGIIDAVTGAGKTRLAIAAIAEHTDLGGKVVVVVPTISLIHQWYEAIEALLPDLTIGLVGGGYDDSLDDVDVLISTVASARNRRFTLNPGEVGLLVADECHRMASTVNRQALDARFTKRLGLSATHERMDDLHTEVLLPYFAGVTYSLGYREAIDDGVIANVRVAFVGVEFTPEEAESYREMTERLSSLRRKLVGHFGCRPAPFSAFLDDVLALTRKGDRQEGMAANAWLTTWRARRELLAETPAKVEALTAMIGAINDSIGTMIFTQSIESANDIEDELSSLGVPTSVHHSEISDYERGEILEAFGERRLKASVSVQTLEEGVDVPDADLAIIVAASKQRRQMIQRMGRVMRQKADGRDARFVILYVEDTDEDPRLGAHELFVNELIEVAREVDAFALPENGSSFRTFLSPKVATEM
jgi:RNA polymerase primary sigma factor